MMRGLLQSLHPTRPSSQSEAPPPSNCHDAAMQVTIKTPAEQEQMRVAGRLAADVLDMIGPYVVPGVTTDELNERCHDYIVNVQQAIPAPLNYRGFPKSICTSVNHVVCHGIPSDKRLKQGDIINVDVTVIKDGWHGDTSRMYAVGKIAPAAQRLIDITHEAMWIGIRQVRPGARLGDLGAAIQRLRRAATTCSVVREYCGHGIGRGSSTKIRRCCTTANARHRGFELAPDDLLSRCNAARFFLDSATSAPRSRRSSSRSTCRSCASTADTASAGSSTRIRRCCTTASAAGVELQPGMTFTVEPMVNAGKRHVRLLPDGWTVITKDHSLSAQWEHTVLVTDTGYEVLTLGAAER